MAFDPASPAAEGKVKVVVTVTGEADGKINIGVKCGTDDTLEAKDYDVTDGKATSGEFNAPVAPDAGAAKITCTATASGKVGGEELSKTGSFTIAAADEPPAPTITLVDPVVANKDTSTNLDVSFTHENLAATAAFMVHVACDDNTAPADVAAVKTADETGKACSDGDSDAANGVQCTLPSGGSAGQFCAVVVVSGTTDSNLGTTAAL